MIYLEDSLVTVDNLNVFEPADYSDRRFSYKHFAASSLITTETAKQCTLRPVFYATMWPLDLALRGPRFTILRKYLKKVGFFLPEHGVIGEGARVDCNLS